MADLTTSSSGSSSGGDDATLTYWQEGAACCDEEWERAYTDFETPEEEIRKFLSRHRKLGLTCWPRQLQVVEIFCGRGNGLKALERLGFTSIEGVDLSPTLLRQYRGPARLYVGDCRRLGFADETKDAVIVQGGLHHLRKTPEDLAQVLAEAQRVLVADGRIVIVEPWLTPFLRLAHQACENRTLRRLWPKLDALARMTEQEQETYYQWLAQPTAILELLDQHFQCERRRIAFGKLMYVGKKAH